VQVSPSEGLANHTVREGTVMDNLAIAADSAVGWEPMHPLSYRRHRFPPVVIQHAIWLYLRSSLSYRDVEELACRAAGARHFLRERSQLGAQVRTGDRPGLCEGAVLDRVIAGISTKWSSGSPAGICTCGAASIMRARSSRSWFSADETSRAAVRLMRKLPPQAGLRAENR